MIVEIKFLHRCNPDGRWQSICPECYKTVAESSEEADLMRAEGTHVCLSLNGRLIRIDQPSSLARYEEEPAFHPRTQQNLL